MNGEAGEEKASELRESLVVEGREGKEEDREEQKENQGQRGTS
jgi:hypothetical protein